MAGLALIQKIVLIQTDLWIVTVDIIQPNFVMDNQARLFSAYLAQTAVYCHPLVNVYLPSPAPRRGFIELFLCHHARIHPSLLAHKEKETWASLPKSLRYYNITFQCVILCHLSMAK